MNHSSDHDLVLLHPINNAIAINNNLSNVLIVEFRNFASRAWETPNILVWPMIFLTTIPA